MCFSPTACSSLPQPTHTSSLGLWNAPMEFWASSPAVAVCVLEKNQWFPRCLSFKPCGFLFVQFPQGGSLSSPLEKTHLPLESQTKCHAWDIYWDLCSLSRQNQSQQFPQPFVFDGYVSACLAGPWASWQWRTHGFHHYTPAPDSSLSKALWAFLGTDSPAPRGHTPISCLWKSFSLLGFHWVPKSKFNQRSEKMQKQRERGKQDKMRV